MLTVEIIAPQRRRLTLLWRRRCVFRLPQSWTEVPADQRRAWWSIAVSNAEQCSCFLLSKIVPRRWRIGLSDTDRAALIASMYWTRPIPDSGNIPLSTFRYRGADFDFPAANGENMACLEFATADDLYGKYVEKQDANALEELSWTLWREREPDAATRAARADDRVLLHGIGEVRERQRRYGPAPVEMQVQALLYFAGLKQYLQSVYGAYIFEQPDEDDDETPAPRPDNGPNFGWWGIFQAVAEAGIFGDCEKVFQTNLHEVCVYLVRKKVESDRIRNQSPSPTPRHDDLY